MGRLDRRRVHCTRCLVVPFQPERNLIYPQIPHLSLRLLIVHAQNSAVSNGSYPVPPAYKLSPDLSSFSFRCVAPSLSGISEL